MSMALLSMTVSQHILIPNLELHTLSMHHFYLSIISQVVKSKDLSLQEHQMFTAESGELGTLTGNCMP